MDISAIDIGFLYTKGIINSSDIMMKSIIGNSKNLRFKELDLSSRKGDNIQSMSQGQKYFVSDLAIKQSDAIIHSLKDNRFNSNATKVLVDTLFGMGFKSGHNVTGVVSGLPVSHYSQFKHNIEELFMSTPSHTFEVQVNSMHTYRGSVSVIKSLFIPQPFGVLMNEILNDSGKIQNKELASKVVAIVDCGFGTSDIYVTDALSPVERITFSTQTAMNHAYGLISSKLEDISGGISIPLHKIESIVESGVYSIGSKSYKVDEVANWAFKLTAEQLVSEIYNKWKTTQGINRIILAGGGGIRLAPYIQNELGSVVLSKDGQWSVARGYKKWGIRTWKDE